MKLLVGWKHRDDPGRLPTNECAAPCKVHFIEINTFLHPSYSWNFQRPVVLSLQQHWQKIQGRTFARSSASLSWKDLWILEHGKLQNGLQSICWWNQPVQGQRGGISVHIHNVHLSQSKHGPNYGELGKVETVHEYIQRGCDEPAFRGRSPKLEGF